MSNFSLDSIFLFIVFFFPGFISIKVYDQLIPSEKRNFSKSLYEVLAFSTINLALLSWLVYLNINNAWWDTFPGLFIISIIVLFFIFPIFLPVIYLWIIKMNFFANIVINPYLRP